ncbi:hypothetical protein [Afipia broomeae]|uniref:DUF1330 domain-containing protein n=1 Tax=Afipia broomeae ATCC 49717 TaxID=883078 RepID=K8PIW9_9BRAD|nr:hypothetical protein [Afipia broomeae]EKS41486.1 hypothetical protein HMPREF9695_00578 [Afipia broomeae ATCC 49717]
MHLVELLLPLQDNRGTPFPRGLFRAVQEHLTDAFGGATAFIRAPAEGTARAEEELERDEIVVFEVMAKELDRDWWREYRAQLESTFKQRKIVIRTHQVELL